jgi:hypothetical protein
VGGHVPLRRLDVPRSVVLLALCLVLVPAVLWLFVVWDTRPPDPADVAADRARVESTAQYAETLDWCRWQYATRTCEDAAYRMASEAPPTIDLIPEPWDVATLAVLAMAGTSLAVGVVWRAGPGFRAFLRRSAIVAAGSWLVAAEVGVFWFLGLSWVAASRGLGTYVPDDTWSFVRYGALLVGLAGLAGTALGALRGRTLAAVLAAAGVAVSAGLVALVASPPDPWLPPLNVEAFLFGGALYEGPPDTEVCTSTPSRWELLPGETLGTGRLHIRVDGFDTCTRELRLAPGEATLRLGGLALLAWLVAAVTQRGRTPGPTSPAPDA